MAGEGESRGRTRAALIDVEGRGADRKTSGSKGSRPTVRVLHVLEATLGGTRRYIEDIVRVSHLVPADMALAYAMARADAGFAEVLNLTRAAGWRTFEIGMVRHVSPHHDMRAILQLARVIRNYRPAIIHCHSAKAGAVGRLAAQLARTPARVFYSPHALPIGLGGHYMIVEKLLARWTDVFVAVSDGEAEEIAGAGLGARQIAVVSPVVDTQVWHPLDRQAARRSLGIDQDAAVIAAIARFTLQKDPITFVNLLAAVRKIVPNTVGVWVGDGELRGPVERRARELGVDASLRITGWITDVRPFIASSNVVVSTSKWESFGYVVREALSMERAVVSTRIPGVIDILDTVDKHVLFPVEDYESGAAIVCQLLADPTLADEIGRRGRGVVAQQCTGEQMARNLTKLYCPERI